ncbi:hypothetical protein [Nocardia sp. NPDC005366]|uniref:hypothetical protein n=1 Tax=Nocardia sp. NPDC005366 TaxID=3156878 RepID=UPI0033A85DA8
MVTHAGGWLFDRAMAGWEVVVLVDETDDRRALEILGAHVVDLESALASPIRIPLPQAIAVDSQLYRADARVRDGIAEVFDYRLIDEVTMWGDGVPYDLEERLIPVRHRLSTAARMFKQTALSAAGARSAPTEPSELFRSRTALSRPQGMRDLAPVTV